MTDPAAPHGTAQDYANAQLREWGAYVARVPIDFYGQRAFNVGDPVPVSAVDGDTAWVDPGWVDAQGTPYAGSATVPPPEPPPIDPEVAAGPPASSPEDPGTTVTSSEG